MRRKAVPKLPQLADEYNKLSGKMTKVMDSFYTKKPAITDIMRCIEAKDDKAVADMLDIPLEELQGIAQDFYAAAERLSKEFPEIRETAELLKHRE